MWQYRSDGKRLERGRTREPVPRGNQPTPCGSCPKIPPDARARTPAHAEELSERNLLAWQHYQRCQAVGQFPDDPLVRRNAAIMAQIEKELEDQRWQTFFSMLRMLGGG